MVQLTTKIFVHCLHIELKSISLCFFKTGGKPESLEKNPCKKDENQQQTQPGPH